MITGQDIVDEIRTWVGTPVGLAGSVKGKGCNCLGMMAGAAKNLGREDLWQEFEPYQGLPHAPDRLFMIRKLRLCLEPIKHRDIVPGCLVFMSEHGSSHVAVVTDTEGPVVVEAIVPFVRETIMDRPFIQAFRIPGVCYE